MPRVSAKRQITLPVADCEELGIEPGDEVEIFRHGNQFNIIKKEVGVAAGLLKGTKVNHAVSDGQSRQNHFE
ncbi:AbrB/MazE/SpoVT family DNA-binding domain-containing protein [Nitrosomonas ureae]|uniref:Antidote-toxin recognition MazE, antitoxin n=1 Tax=Nitrosomonas ureae TaxID=44577 RepID=A0A1H9E465_9PROT|nr:AbrB/MazE/SpoVT family DNA-binding domain-containing protein [Nitrosomonas ureae]SEQ20529.1 Antidote-toxin recognition MazE, antitoxin [Nitrosomonas ureae]SOD22425.1 Antidote-toxin recognition MazE, antitoxin [Nitrosomonas ureae]